MFTPHRNIKGYASETMAYWLLNPAATNTQIATIDSNIRAIKYTTAGVALSSVTMNFSTGAVGLITNCSQDLRWLAITALANPLISIRANDGTYNFVVKPVAVGTTETYGSEIATGTLTDNLLYKIVATEANHFGTGKVVGNYFTSAGTETCDANNIVKQVLTPDATGFTLTGMSESFSENAASFTVSSEKIGVQIFEMATASSQTIAGVFRTTGSGNRLYVDWGDNTWGVYAGTADQAYSHDYGSVGSRTIKFYASSAAVFTKITITSTSGVSFSLSSLPAGMTFLNCSGSNTVSGRLSSLPAGMTTFSCSGSNTVSGSLSSLPSVMTGFNCYGSNTISGNLSSLPSVMTSFNCTGSNTISGNLSSLPSVMTTFNCSGSNTVSGSLSSLPAGMTLFSCSGANTVSDYTTKSWANNQQKVYLVPVGAGGLATAEIDQLLIDLSVAGGTWASSKEIYLKGTNAARSAASDAAVATLVGKGVTVTTN